MKYILAFSFFVLTMPSYGSQPKNIHPSNWSSYNINIPDKSITLKYNKNKVDIIMANNYEQIVMNAMFMDATMKEVYRLAKSACDLQYKPQNVTVSLGFISATWDINSLCKN